MITTQASDELAHQIYQLHKSAEEINTTTLAGINELIQSRLDCAALVETAKASKGQHFRQWWEEAGLPEKWAARYLTISKTSKRLKLGDKSQMRLIGILREQEGQRPQQQRKDNSLEWIKLSVRLLAALSPERIAKMDNFQRRLAADKLKPIIEIYSLIERQTSV